MGYNAVLLSSMSPYHNLRVMKEMHDKIQGMFMREFRTKRPTVGYIDSGYDENFRQFRSIRKLFRIMFKIETVHFLDLTKRYSREREDRVLDCDVIFLAGGNTFDFLLFLKYRGTLERLRQAKKEKIFMGTSAGAIICTNDILIASFADENRNGLNRLDSLGLTKVAFKPHFDSWIGQKELFASYSELAGKTVYGCYEGSGVIIDDGTLSEHGPMFVAQYGDIIKER